MGCPEIDIARPSVVPQAANWQRNQTKDHKKNYAKMDE